MGDKSMLHMKNQQYATPIIHEKFVYWYPLKYLRHHLRIFYNMYLNRTELI